MNNETKNIKIDKVMDFILKKDIYSHLVPVISFALTKEKIPVIEILCKMETGFNIYAYAFIRYVRKTLPSGRGCKDIVSFS